MDEKMDLGREIGINMFKTLYKNLRKLVCVCVCSSLFETVV